MRREDEPSYDDDEDQDASSGEEVQGEGEFVIISNVRNGICSSVAPVQHRQACWSSVVLIELVGVFRSPG
jgi:hypothetical protein